MFPGFNNKKRSTISRGDWDRDGVSNRKDCEPLNFKKQDGGGPKFVTPSREQLEEERRLKLKREGASRMRSDIDLKIVNRGHKQYAEAEEELRALRRSLK